MVMDNFACDDDNYIMYTDVEQQCYIPGIYTIILKYKMT